MKIGDVIQIEKDVRKWPKDIKYGERLTKYILSCEYWPVLSIAHGDPCIRNIDYKDGNIILYEGVYKKVIFSDKEPENKDTIEKLSLGLMPLRYFEKNKIKERINDITSAMYRYQENDKVIPREWISELIGRVDELRGFYE